MTSRFLRFGASLVTSLCLLAPAVAQTGAFPNRPVTLVVPFPPGGSMDALARITATKLSESWGKPVLVDNRAGAGGLIGAQRVKAAPADGYTLLVTNSALVQSAVSPLVTTPPYDPINDFTPVVQMTLAPVVYVVNPRLPVKTLQEYVSLVQREPGKHTFGSGGANQTLHLLGAVFNDAAKLDMVHLPFKGDAAIVNDLVGGHISGAFATISTAKPHIEAGTLRALAVAGPRSPLLPGVPSFRDAGYNQLDVVGWFAMFAPANMPKPVVDKISADVTAVLKTPEVERRLTDMSLTPTVLGPVEFERIVKRDLGYWDNVMKKVGEK